MKADLKKFIEEIKADTFNFLKFLKLEFPLFHNSVFFFRDLQYGVEKFMRKKNIELSYYESEQMAEELRRFFEQEGIFVKIKDSTWKINFPEFVTQIPGDPFQ
jgi:hypothetical protein